MLRGLKETKKLSGEVAGVAMNVAKAGLAVGAIAVTGGAAAAAGGLGAAAGGAGGLLGRAGLAGAAGTAGRISGTLKSVSSGIGKFTTGGYEGKPGIIGGIGRVVRGETIGAIKEGTS